MKYRGINEVRQFGQVDKDPELRTTNNGQRVVNFTLVVDTYYEHDGKEKRQREYSKCVAWGKLADTVQKQLVAGSWALVTGRQSTRSWEDRDGNKRYTTENTLTDFITTGAPVAEGNAAPGGNGGDSPPPPQDDDIPF